MDNNPELYLTNRTLLSSTGLGAPARMVIYQRKSWLCSQRKYFAPAMGTRSDF
jgi:hypothetical protein